MEPAEAVLPADHGQPHLLDPGFKKQNPGFKRPHGTPSTTYWPKDVCRRYGLPNLNVVGPIGTAVKIGVISLGGGYSHADVAAAMQAQGFTQSQTPMLTDVSVLGASNRPGSDADVENALDVQIVAGTFTSMTGLSANIRVYFAPNSDQGIAAAISQADADGCGVISFSWGGPEKNYPSTSRAAIGAEIAKFTARGGKFLAASGDNGSSDGDPGANVDYTGSDPNTLCVGGTTLNAGSESVWGTNTPGEGTGGGFSAFYAKPTWQNGNSQAARLVPDFAANADPQTGWNIVEKGGVMPIGGTSASTPHWAAIIAALDTARAAKGFPLILSFAQFAYANTVCFNDITSGNNGQYQAKTGLDPCTGLGSPNGAVLADKYLAANPTQTPTPPTPPAPQPPPVIPPPHGVLIDPLDNQLLQYVGQRLKLKVHSPAFPTDVIGLGK